MPKKFSKKQINSFHPVRDSRFSIRKQKYRQSLTGFQERVYRIVKKIPKGEVLTYKEVARRAGSPRAWRAVGNILSKNKDPKIPCHRVIRSDGKAGGYNRGPRTFSGQIVFYAKHSPEKVRGGQKRKIELLKKEKAL